MEVMGQPACWWRRKKVERQTPQSGDPLSPREQQVMDLLVEGLSNKLIAARLGIAEDTTKFHLSHAMVKVGAAGNRTLAAVLWDRRRRDAAASAGNP